MFVLSRVAILLNVQAMHTDELTRRWLQCFGWNQIKKMTVAM